jgi:hypothetical protein
MCSFCSASHPDEQTFVRDFNKRQQERKEAKQTEVSDQFYQALASAWAMLSIHNGALIEVRK